MERIKNKALAIAVVVFACMATLMMQGCKDKDDEPQDPETGCWDPIFTKNTLVSDYLELRAFNSYPEIVYDYRCLALIPDKGPMFNGHFLEMRGMERLEGRFEELCQLNGDTCFSESLPCYAPIRSTNDWVIALQEDVTDIQVTALSDYSTAYPAGSSLTEITNVSYLSYYPFIQAGYVFNESSKGNGFHPLAYDYNPEENLVTSFSRHVFGGYQVRDLMNHCKATDIPANNLKMVSGDAFFWLSLDSMPDQECLVEVAVTVQLRNGAEPARTVRQQYRVGRQTTHDGLLPD